MIHRSIQLAAVLLALAARLCAQSQGREPVERLGLDLSGIERGKTAAPAAAGVPAAKDEKRAKGPTEITAHEAIFDNKEHQATFTNEVLVRDPEFGLSSDRLTVFLKQPAPAGTSKPAEKPPEKPDAKAGANGDANSGIDRAVAEGNVTITQDKKEVGHQPEHYEGKGKRAVFDNRNGTLTLTGRPRISQSVNGIVTREIITLEESGVIIMNRAGKIEVHGLHKSTLHDTADSNPAPR
jgi:lipopolysaccharide export system protein LptA